MESLFTNAPLDTTINIILKQIYENKEKNTNIQRKDKKDLILLCTKTVQLKFDNEIYKQTDGVAMGFPLDPVLAEILMVELEKFMV